MRALVLALAAVSLAAAGCKKGPPPGPTVSKTFDERQACTADADCAAVEVECCDHCNGGTAVGVHRDYATDVRKEYAGTCADVACTLMACPEAQPICRQGRCGVAIGGTESLPDLPAR